MFCPNDVTLTNSEIMSLVGSINGKPTAARAENKAAAVLALNKAMTVRIGRSPMQWEMEAVLGESNFVGAHKVLGELIERVENAGSTDHDLAELMRPDETTTEAEENNMQDTQISDSKVPSSVSTEKPEQAPATAQTSAPASGKSGARGRKSSHAGKSLFAIGSDNPRRAGSHGQKSLQIVLDNPGITTKDYLTKGGRLNDLNWDIEHNRIEAK